MVKVTGSPTARLPMILQVTTPAASVQPTAETNSTRSGSVSTTLTPEAGSGPRLVTSTVYEKVSPTVTTSGLDLINSRSAVGTYVATVSVTGIVTSSSSRSLLWITHPAW